MNPLDIRRARINTLLIDDLERQLWMGDSLILLGPRRAGKRYILRTLRQRLQAKGRTRLDQVSFLDQSAHHDGDFDSSESRRLRERPRTDRLLEWIDREFQSGPGIVTLLVSNIDLVPRERLRAFLGGIRQRVEGRGVPDGCRLAVVLTGEIDLGSVMLPELSEFRCCVPYLIYGFDRPIFDQIVQHYLRILGRNFIERPSPEDLEEVFRRTGGNTYFLRLLLWTLFDRHAGQFDGEGQRVRLGDPTDKEVVDNMRWNSRLRYVHGTIDSNKDSWFQLEALIRDGEVSVSDSAPHPFELAGLAIREDGRLIPASSLSRVFLETHYNARRLADNLAREDEWKEAFGRYRPMKPRRRQRPTSVDDVIDATDLVKSLRTALHRRSHGSPQGVLDLFASGCRDMLGFRAVTRWRRGDGWTPIVEGGFDGPATDTAFYLEILGGVRGSADLPVGRFDSDDECSQCIITARLPTVHPTAHEILIVGAPGHPTILSQARATLCKRLVDDLIEAYGHAIEDERLRDQLRTRALYTEIVNKIAASIGGEVVETRRVLEMAADELKKYYNRVMFSLVDPRGTRIEAVVERSPDERRRTAELTSYTFGDQSSGHTWVVENKAPLAVDASTDPRTCKEVVDQVEARGIAIVPMITPDGEVIGTVSIERGDGLVPTDDEVAMITDFAKQLASVLLLTERVEFYRKALDTRIEPIAFFDRLRGELRLRYANKAASRALGRLGWLKAGEAPTYDELRADPLCRDLAAHFDPLIDNALERRKPSEGSDVIAFPFPPPRGTVVDHIESAAIPFDDYHTEFERFRNETAGVICHVRVVNDLYSTFKAIKIVIGARSREQLITNVIDSMQEMGHTRGRLYLVDDGKDLVGKLCFGMVDGAVGRFAPGQVRLGAKDDPEAWESWLAIEKREPVVFHFDPHGEDHQTRRTREGLKVVVCRSPRCSGELEKKPGDYWIDFPLLAGDKVVGKLTLDCMGSLADEDGSSPSLPEAKHPRDLEFLRVFCELVDVLLQAWSAWDREFEEKLEMRRALYEAGAHEALHDVKTPLVRLALCRDTFMRLEDRFDQATLREGIDDLEKIMDEFQSRYNETIEHPLDGTMRFESTDLAALLESLEVAVVASVAVARPAEAIAIEADPTRLGRALRQLMLNAEEHSEQPRDALHVTIGTEPFERDGLPWIRIILADNGVGVPEGEKARIFQKYVTLHAREGMHGLGLDYVQNIVLGHGGTIREEGIHGNGAKFVVELPRSQSLRP